MNITEINDNNFEETVQSHPKVILDCYAPWCSSCKMFAPVFEELSNEEPGVKFCKMNTDESPDTAERFDIMSIPTVLVFENGQLKSRETGLKTKEEIKNMF